MSKKPIFIIASKEEHDFYRNLPIRDERIIILSFGDSLELLKDCDTDMIILDCGNEPTTGLQILSDIKAIRPDLPVVFLTEVSSEEMSISAFRKGARDYFKKPINIFEVTGAIENLLKVKRSSHEQRVPFMLTERSNIIEILKSTTPDLPSNILNAIQFIDENISTDIFIGELAKIAKLSKFHFCRIFKKIVGMSPMRFVIFMRIQKAKELLGMNYLTISKISTEVGFNDISNFNRYFKQFTKVTPSAYKRLVRKNHIMETSDELFSAIPRKQGLSMR